MKAVMISIQPKWVEKIASGQKTLEVRKTAPKCEVPFKCYIYATKAKKWFHSGIILTSNELLWLSNGKIKMCDGFELWVDGKDYQCVNNKVIGEFVCDKVFLLHPYTYDGGSADLERRKFIQTFEGSSKGNEILAATCLTQDEMFDYIGAGNYGYGWHISDLKIYDKPKELSEFFTPMGKRPSYMVERPPQSWQYVEE